MVSVGGATVLATPAAAPDSPILEQRLVHRLFTMHRRNTERESEDSREAGNDTVAGAAGHAYRKVVACRQKMFLNALCLLSGMRGHAVNHEQALAHLRDARDDGCAAAMAVLCADHSKPSVRKSAFIVLRDVSLSAGGGFYAHGVIVSCKTLCARICELELVESPEDYNYLDEYEEASKLGCVGATVFRGHVLETNERCGDALCDYTSAATGGYAVALYHMARCTRDGIGVEQNVGRAMQIMKQSSDKSFFWGMFDRAKMLLDSNAENLEQRATYDGEAFQLLKEVETGVAHARKFKDTPMRCRYLQFCRLPPNPCKQLALCYEQGRGVARNREEAERYTALFEF
jgi:TPR repeat protein